MRRTLALIGLMVLLSASLPTRASASQIGILQQLSPVAKTYLLGEGLDFLPFTFSGLGDVTAAIFAVDPTIPPGPVPSTSTSGCEAADFAGFIPGRIALIQRGTCTFAEKVFNAAASGAAGVLIFNEGQPGRTETIDASLESPAPLPAAFVSFAVGLELFNAFQTGGAIVRFNVTDSSPRAITPEPATLALLGIGLSAAAIARRRTRGRLDASRFCGGLAMQ